MKIKICLTLILFLMSLNVFAGKDENELAVHLLNYLTQDYAGAVQNGKIVSNDEYQEQMEFITEVVRISDKNSYDTELKTLASTLYKSIVNKEKGNEVSFMATRLKLKIIKKYNLLTYPVTKIDLIKAEKLFKNNCMSCHGLKGYGDGKAGKGMDPAPANFHDLERMHNISPYGAFNTISFGVSGTGMAAYDSLSIEDRWSLVYYITSFRFKGITKKSLIYLDIKETSSLSDNEIRRYFYLDDLNFMEVLASLRDTDSSSLGGAKKVHIKLHLTKAINDLRKSFSLYKAGEIHEARKLGFSAYLMGVEPVESVMRAFNEKEVLSLEKNISIFRSSIFKRGSVKELKIILDKIILQLEAFISLSKPHKT